MSTKKAMKDSGFITYKDITCTVSQASPTIEIMNMSVKCQTFHKKYTRGLKLIEVLNNKLDGMYEKIDTDNCNDSAFLNDILDIESKIEQKENETLGLIKYFDTTIDTVLIHLLGSTALEQLKKKGLSGILEKAELMSMCGQQNTYVKKALENAKEE